MISTQALALAYVASHPYSESFTDDEGVAWFDGFIQSIDIATYDDPEFNKFVDDNMLKVFDVASRTLTTETHPNMRHALSTAGFALFCGQCIANAVKLLGAEGSPHQ